MPLDNDEREKLNDVHDAMIRLETTLEEAIIPATRQTWKNKERLDQHATGIKIMVWVVGTVVTLIAAVGTELIP